MPTAKTPAPASTEPVGTPPGGGSWTWSPELAAWVPAAPAKDTTETPQE
jgi:hypothetical protein